VTLTTPSRYSPWIVDPKVLHALLVGRDELRRHLVTSLREVAVGGGGRYELVVGPRGAGKSHLLALVHAALVADDAAGEKFVVAALGEEESIASFASLLGRLLRAMPAEPGLPDPHAQFLMLQQGPLPTAAERATALIKGRLKGRALIVFVENLDMLFAAIGRSGQQHLRRLLQTEGNWSIMAGSRTAEAGFLKESEPFFRTFNRNELAPLTPTECREMLRRLAAHMGKEDLAEFLAGTQGLARVKALCTFTGGNPRAMALVFPYLTREGLDDLVQSFYAFADELTPYFQEQLARLPPGQATLLEALAENWRPMTVKALAQATFTPETTASSQLRRMQKDHLVQAVKHGRHTLYEVAEPLFRIARAMKRTDQAVPTLARFLRIWYACEDLLPLLGRPELRDLVLWALATPRDHRMPRPVGDPASTAVAMFGAERYSDVVDYLRRLGEAERQEELAALAGLVPDFPLGSLMALVPRSAFRNAPEFAGILMLMASANAAQCLRVVEAFQSRHARFATWVWHIVNEGDGLAMPDDLPSVEEQVAAVIAVGAVGLLRPEWCAHTTAEALVGRLLEVERALAETSAEWRAAAANTNLLLVTLASSFAVREPSTAWFKRLMLEAADFGPHRMLVEALTQGDDAAVEALSSEERVGLETLKQSLAGVSQIVRLVAQDEFAVDQPTTPPPRRRRTPAH
jgi:hypothetical protein